ncbi:ABC transporter ATP-binding protein [Maritimibacter sp. 55A14]|uniref:ABC transporter ATP-binding protein n=1 Tax=Maritimibacter sp. 55A14 TaxID=2174844 RepID=UPI000D6207B7|nr:ATP-binding cassette domain-containing protein [Maritimibacter sp. 55A14]PWE32806.1 ABC transporter ATP-binding protein [Maritimibacter sp. 55A14]
MTQAAPSLSLSGAARIDGAPLFGPLGLDVRAGRWTCLLGPSGVGKTTILRLFAGLAEEVEFTGTIAADDGLPLTGRVALMAQSDLLFPWLDVLGNVALGARLRGERPDLARARRMIDRVGLDRHATKKPHALSGGQRQRAALARTLMEDRPVILLDEPFSALDARTRAEMQDLAVELLDRRTVLLVTHDPAEAARLGHDIRILTETGLDELSPPAGAPPRPVDDRATLEAQGRLLRRLRSPA